MQERYKSAMTLAWGRRIEFLHPKPTVYTLHYRFPQERWMRFLATMEPQFPGITGTARGLLATLRLGLGELLHALPYPQGFKWNIGWVEDFAQFIVRRMVQTRADIVFSTEQA